MDSSYVWTQRVGQKCYISMGNLSKLYNAVYEFKAKLTFSSLLNEMLLFFQRKRSHFPSAPSERLLAFKLCKAKGKRERQERINLMCHE